MNKYVSGDIVSKFLKVSERRVQQLVKEGILTKVRRGEYPLLENVHRYIDYIGARTSLDDDIDDNELNVLYKKEKVRLTKYQANEQKVKADIAEKKVISVAIVETALANLFALIRDKTLSVPQRVELELLGETDSGIFNKVLIRELKDALFEVRDGAKEVVDKILESDIEENE